MIVLFPYLPLYTANGVIGDDGEEISLEEYKAKYGERGSVMHMSMGEFKYASAEEREKIISQLNAGIEPPRRKSIFEDE